MTWRVGINAKPFDLLLLKENFSPPIVINSGDEVNHYYVSNLPFYQILTSDQVYASMQRLVTEWNCYLSIISPPFSLIETSGSVDKLADDEPIHRTSFITPHSATLSLHSTSPTLSVDGVFKTVRSKGERMRELILSNYDFAKAMSIFTQSPHDFRGLYVAMEHIRDGIGAPIKNKEAKWSRLAATGWMTEEQQSRFKTTANEKHRHAATKATTDMSIDEANQIVRSLLAQWADRDVPN